MQGSNEPLLSSGNCHMTYLPFHHLEASRRKRQRLLISRWRKHVPIQHIAESQQSEYCWLIFIRTAHEHATRFELTKTSRKVARALLSFNRIYVTLLDQRGRKK